MTRPDHLDYWFTLAEYVSLRATCPKRSVGAVLVSAKGHVLATGYNGAPTGLPHCVDIGCLLDEQGDCRRAVHAEANVILQAARNGVRVEGATMYCTYQPCPNCSIMLVNSGVQRVVYRDLSQHGDPVRSEIREMVAASHVTFEHWKGKA